MDTVCLDPLTIAISDVLGRHYIASREIQADDVILEETSVLSYPWCRNKSAIICLSCYKKLEFANLAVCALCKWPVCDEICATAMEHASSECKILTENVVEFDYSRSNRSYLCIQALRGLLVMEKSPTIFEEIKKLEAHNTRRQENSESAEETAHVVDFIRNKCKLNCYDDEIIKQIFGATEINTFGFSDGRHGCMLFLHSSIFAHDCEPSTSKCTSKIETGGSTKYCITFTTKRRINPGEIITINYGDITTGVIERRARLKREFCFDCGCKRCRVELMHLGNIAPN